MPSGPKTGGVTYHVSLGTALRLSQHSPEYPALPQLWLLVRDGAACLTGLGLESVDTGLCPVLCPAFSGTHPDLAIDSLTSFSRFRLDLMMILILQTASSKQKIHNADTSILSACTPCHCHPPFRDFLSPLLWFFVKILTFWPLEKATYYPIVSPRPTFSPRH
jgi:hypothetical protein